MEVWMKKIGTILSLCCILVISGCGGRSTSEGITSMIIGGSTSIQPLMESIAETYNEKNDALVSIQGGGSSVGIKGTEDGTFQLGMVSRELKPEEAKQLDQTIIALDGIVVVVHKDNPVDSITMEQLKDIYTGKITNWKNVGGDDKEIAVVSREEGSGTRDGFESIVGFTSSELIRNSDIQNATGSIISDVSVNEHGIGYISLGSLSDNVKVLEIDGVLPSEESVKDGTYKIQRAFLLVQKKGEKQGSELFDFIFSEEGKKLIEAHNYIPVERK